MSACPFACPNRIVHCECSRTSMCSPVFCPIARARSTCVPLSLLPFLECIAESDVRRRWGARHRWWGPSSSPPRTTSLRCTCTSWPRGTRARAFPHCCAFARAFAHFVVSRSALRATCVHARCAPCGGGDAFALQTSRHAICAVHVDWQDARARRELRDAPVCAAAHRARPDAAARRRGGARSGDGRDGRTRELRPCVPLRAARVVRCQTHSCLL